MVGDQLYHPVFPVFEHVPQAICGQHQELVLRSKVMVENLERERYRECKYIAVDFLGYNMTNLTT